MAFGFNWKPQQIPTQMKGAQFAPQKVGLDQDFPSLVNGAIGRSPEEIAVEQNLNERQVGNANDMANWIQQGGTPQADAAAAAQAQAEQEALQKQERIKEIESEIAEIEQRIAERKRGMATNEDALNTQLAAIEARKINRQDPTSIWRWKAGMDFQKQSRKEDLARAEAEKQKSKEEQKQFVRNKISSTIPTMSIGWNTSPEQIQQFKNTLASLKTEAMNNKLNAEMNDILDMEAQLNGELPKQRAQIAMNKMKNAENLFNATKEDGGFGKDPKAYHNYLLQQFTQITRDYPEAAYDPAFIQAFEEADAKFKKQVKTPKVKAPGRK